MNKSKKNRAQQIFSIVVIGVTVLLGLHLAVNQINPLDFLKKMHGG